MSLVVIFGLAIECTVGNYIARALGSTALEEFSSPDVGFIATIAALLILPTQHHEEELAEGQAQLTLHIALLEEQRRDNPLLPSRTDHEAAAMEQPSDHEAALDLIDEATDLRQQSAGK